jgi:thioredoxin 1
VNDDTELAAIRQRRLRELERAAAAGPGPTALTDESFADFVSSHEVALVDFWAAWCAPCRLVAPIVEEVARDYAGRVAVGKVDTDRCPVTAGMFGVTAIPTLAIFRSGKLVDAIVGAVPKARLTSRLERALSAPRSAA